TPLQTLDPHQNQAPPMQVDAKSQNLQDTNQNSGEGVSSSKAKSGSTSDARKRKQYPASSLGLSALGMLQQPPIKKRRSFKKPKPSDEQESTTVARPAAVQVPDELREWLLAADNFKGRRNKFSAKQKDVLHRRCQELVDFLEQNKVTQLDPVKYDIGMDFLRERLRQCGYFLVRTKDPNFQDNDLAGRIQDLLKEFRERVNYQNRLR